MGRDDHLGTESLTHFGEEGPYGCADGDDRAAVAQGDLQGF